MAKIELNFTKAAFAKIERPTKGRTEVYDTRVPGLILRVSPAGTLTFAVYRRVNGSPKRVRIGTYPHMTIDQARTVARQTLNEMSAGVDPIARKRAERTQAATLGEMFERYVRQRKAAGRMRPRTEADYRECMRVTFGDWQTKPVTAITRGMIEQRHEKRSAESPSRANHAMRVLRAVLNYTIEVLEDESGNPVLASNPVKRLSAVGAWHRLERKQGMVKAHDLPGWFKAVMALEGERNGSNAQTAADFLAFVMLTGLRKNEAAQLPWASVDLRERTFTVSVTKNGDALKLPLSDYLEEMLKRRSRERVSDYVFGTATHPGYIADPRWWAAKVTAASGIDFTIHDLRRTYVTVAEGLDISAYAIKRLVNHRVSKADVTDGYVVWDVERLRKPMQQVTDYVLKTAGVKPSAGVVNLTKGRKNEARQ